MLVSPGTILHVTARPAGAPSTQCAPATSGAAGNETCSTPACSNTSRWPRRNRSQGWCDACLTNMVQAAGATVVALGDGPRDRFRTRHDACGAVVDVSLAMIRRGGWVCQACKWLELGPRYRAMNAVRGDWLVARQEQLLAAAGMRSLLLLGDADGFDPVNVECLHCGGAQANHLDGIAEGLRLSWLPCTHCNTARFAPTTETIGARFADLGLKLLEDFDGNPGRLLQASCRRCSAPRSVSWTAIGSGTPACLRCDGSRLDPDAPHRVYLTHFAHLGDVGVFKVGITHCVDDARLQTHRRAGGTVLEVTEVRDRATALALERRILNRYLPAAAVSFPPEQLPRGGATECWSAHAGHPDLAEEAARLRR